MLLVLLQGMDPDTLGSELPAHVPRYVAYSYCYHHNDGRISYPLCLIHSAPEGIFCIFIFILLL